MSLLPLYSSDAFGTTLQGSMTIFIDLDKNSLGPTSQEVSIAVRHLCGLTFPDESLPSISTDNYYEVARDYYEQIKRLDSTGAQLLTFLAYVSGYYHELRHAHDLLATTYGQEILFRYMNYYQNIWSIIDVLARWLAKNEERRIPLPLRSNQDLMGSLPPELNNIDRQYLNEISEIKRFIYPKRTSPTRLTVMHLLEGSAVNTQFDFLEDVFGDEAVFLLTQFIQKGKRSRVYLQIRNELAEELGARDFEGQGVGTILNYILWCSLMGTTFPNKSWRDAPKSVTLFEALLEHVLMSAKQLDFVSVQDAVIDFYEQWGFIHPQKIIDRTQEQLNSRVNKIEAAMNTYGKDSLAGLVNRAYVSFTKAYASINQYIKEVPEIYFDQKWYVGAVLSGLLPSIFVKLKVNGEVQDFMSIGTKVISYSDWSTMNIASTLFKLLMEGRSTGGSTSPASFYENLCIRVLSSQRWSGVSLRFEDKSDLFNW